MFLQPAGTYAIIFKLLFLSAIVALSDSRLAQLRRCIVNCEKDQLGAWVVAIASNQQVGTSLLCIVIVLTGHLIADAHGCSVGRALRNGS